MFLFPQQLEEEVRANRQKWKMKVETQAASSLKVGESCYCIPIVVESSSVQNAHNKHVFSSLGPDMLMSSNVNTFHITGPLWGESTGDQWIPLTKDSDAELWCFLWSALELMVEQTIERLVIWDAIALIMTSP